MIFLRNVLRAPARSLMTALGIAVGVALFVAITAITLDLQSQIDGATSTYNLEVVVYERRATSPFSSRKVWGSAADSAPRCRVSA